jgi:MraZ protein
LPEEFLAHANITDACAFVGKGKKFQIWQPEAFKTAQDALRQRALRERPTLPSRRPTGDR